MRVVLDANVVASALSAVLRFPYVVFYVVQPTRVAVLAVVHQSRKPGNLAASLR